MANRRALCLTATAARRAEDDGFMSGADGGSPAAADDPVFGDQIAPLRRENQHLLGVNNSLQVRLIEATEARDEAVGALESKNSKLRDQLSSVTFMLKSRAASLADKEKENELNVSVFGSDGPGSELDAPLLAQQVSKRSNCGKACEKVAKVPPIPSSKSMMR